MNQHISTYESTKYEWTNIWTNKVPMNQHMNQHSTFEPTYESTKYQWTNLYQHMNQQSTSEPTYINIWTNKLLMNQYINIWTNKLPMNQHISTYKPRKYQWTNIYQHMNRQITNEPTFINIWTRKVPLNQHISKQMDGVTQKDGLVWRKRFFFFFFTWIFSDHLSLTRILL